MASEINNIINENLIGVDFNVTVNAYCARDFSMGLNCHEQIIKSLKKLGYYNINIPNDINNYCLKKITELISDEFKNNFESDLRTKTIEQLISEIKSTNDFDYFQNKLNFKQGRAILLSKYVNGHCNDIASFYNSLTLDELNYLGY